MFKNFTRHYADQKYYYRKKAEYSMYFILLMMSAVIFIMITEGILNEDFLGAFIKAVFTMIGFITALLLIYKGRIEAGVNLMILLGFARFFMLFTSTSPYQFYMMIIVVLLSVNVIYTKHYQIRIATYGSAIMLVAQTYRIGQLAIVGLMEKRAMMESIVSVYLFIAIIILLRNIRGIIDREIEERQTLSMMAERDSLTSLYNRRKVTEIFHEYMNLGKSFNLMIVDLDDFKDINDHYGHNIGDEILMEISNILTSLDSNNIIARWGGEEFLIFTEEDSQTAERLRQLVQMNTFVHDIHLTVSIGLTLVRPEDTIITAVKRADDALYKSKNQGKNMVTEG